MNIPAIHINTEETAPENEDKYYEMPPANNDLFQSTSQLPYIGHKFGENS